MNINKQIDVMVAYTEGKQIRRRFVNPLNGTGPWVVDNFPTWNWAEYEYEIFNEPKTKSYINWDHVGQKYNYMAMDQNGEMHLFASKPTKGRIGWYTEHSAEPIGDPEQFQSFVKGNCDWVDSLVCRTETQDGSMINM